MPLSNPIISRVAPLKIGGSANAGAGLLASAFDHVHPVTEMSGPTDLSYGDVLDGESVRRVASQLFGRTLKCVRLTANQGSSSVTPIDVSSSLNLDLKANASVLALWVVFYETALATTGLMLTLGYTGTINASRFGILGATAPTTMLASVTTTLGALLGQANVGPAGSDVVTLLFGDIRPVTAGTLSLQFASGVAGSSVTIFSGSMGLALER